jgi:uncharacterized membrane protein YciS (DUF1049 family)
VDDFFTRLLADPDRIGAFIMLVIVVIGAVKEKEWWVSGGRYRKLELKNQELETKIKKNDQQWQSITMRLIEANKESVETNKVLISEIKQRPNITENSNEVV